MVCEKGLSDTTINKNKLSDKNLRTLPTLSPKEAMNSMQLYPEDSISNIGVKRALMQSEDSIHALNQSGRSSKRSRLDRATL